MRDDTLLPWIKDRQKITRDELLWLAGLLEGEGCFHIVSWNNYHYPAVTVKMSDLDVIEKAAKILGANATSHSNGRYTDVCGAYIAGKKAGYMMVQLYPFMGIRRKEQIDYAILKYYTAGPAQAAVNLYDLGLLDEAA